MSGNVALCLGCVCVEKSLPQDAFHPRPYAHSLGTVPHMVLVPAKGPELPVLIHKLLAEMSHETSRSCSLSISVTREVFPTFLWVPWRQQEDKKSKGTDVDKEKQKQRQKLLKRMGGEDKEKLECGRRAHASGLLSCLPVLAIRLVLSKWKEGGGKTEGKKGGTEEDEWCYKLEDGEAMPHQAKFAFGFDRKGVSKPKGKGKGPCMYGPHSAGGRGPLSCPAPGARRKV